MSNCRQGEQCNGTKHTRVGGVHSRCTCYFYANQRKHFAQAGLPIHYLDQKIESVLFEAGRAHVPFRIEPAELIEVVRGLAHGPTKVVKIRSYALDTFPIACWMFQFVAAYLPVKVMSLQDIVTDQFLDKGGERLAKQAKLRTHGLIIRFGRDRTHSYNADTLVDILQYRQEHRAPTIVAEAPSASNPKFVYGSALDWLDQNTRAI